MDDIVIQSGWYSLLYNLKLFKKYPWLASAIRKARIRTHHSDVPLVAQLATKLYALFKR